MVRTRHRLRTPATILTQHLHRRFHPHLAAVQPPSPASGRGLRFGILTILLALVVHPVCTAAEPLKEVQIPDAWRQAPAIKDGFGWYFATIKVPDAWADREWTLILESVDDAREVYIDGNKIGALGAMPPKFRSGIGETLRAKIAKESREDKDEHLLAIRVYFQDGRTGFNVAAPVLVAGDDALRLAGKWKVRPSDEQSVNLQELEPLEPKIESAQAVERELKKLASDDGPLSPQESLARLKTPEDLELKLVLSDPEIGQPLSMKWDARGRLWLVEYLQYPNPAGLKAISRDKFLRTVYDKVPKAPPHHDRGADRITIHEDTNHDGVYDQHKTFVDGLSLASSVALDARGVWVLNPPYLLFYPDANHDDVPDGDPVVHLEGFGIEDAHSLANSLRWGPDGWLYGAQGSTVSGAVRVPGEKQVTHSLGQLIWRYHPAKKKYEVFAEGGGNTFGVEIDSAGHVFSGHNGGNTRGFHYVQGGYSQKGFGKHGQLSNPYTFGYFPAMKHADVPRFTHSFVIYESGALPMPKYANRMFSIAPLQGQVIISQVQRDGSTFQTKDEGYAVTSTDSWFRPVDIQEGPDGAIYIADFYEQRIDHASHYQGRVHPTSGRIYRLAGKGDHRAPQDLGQLTLNQLFETLSSKLRSERQAVQRELVHRANAIRIDELTKRFADASDEQTALENLWVIASRGELEEATILGALKHSSPQVRRWAVRLACDDGTLSKPTSEAVVDLAYRETNVDVRSQLASSARRLPVAESLPIAAKLVAHSEDANDPHVPLLIWWAIETHCEKHRDDVLTWFEDKELWNQPIMRDFVLERLIKRFAQGGSRAELAACAKLLKMSPSLEATKRLMAGLESGIEGRSLTTAPPELIEILSKIGGGSLLLNVRRGDVNAIKEAIEIVTDESGDVQKRLGLMQVLPIGQTGVATLLLELAKNSRTDEVRSAAVSALGASDSPEVAKELIALHEKVSDDLRLVIQSVLLARPAWASELVKAVDAGTIPATRLSTIVTRRLELSNDRQTVELVKKLWPNPGTQNADAVREQLAAYEAKLNSSSGNPYSGRKLFETKCAKCHTLFASGGKIGPDLTVYKRDDIRGLLMNVLSPSLEIREGFETYSIETDDGRSLSGFIADQDAVVVVLRGMDGKNVTVSRDTIEEMRATPISLMPEDLLKDLTDQHVRDLFAYLRSSQPLPD